MASFHATLLIRPTVSNPVVDDNQIILIMRVLFILEYLTDDELHATIKGQEGFITD